MWISNAFARPLLLISALLAFTACGLADDPRDEENKYVYISFSDPAFEKFCLEHFDINGDGRISRYEAQRVVDMNCSGLGIRTLNEISEFSHMRSFDCSGNLLTQLDLSKISGIERVNCSDNQLSTLNVNNLRSLISLDCASNKLTRLDLQSGVSLSTLICSSNDLTTLDISACARTMQAVDTRNNPRLTTLYYAAGQTFRSLQTDGQTQLVER